MTNSLPKIKEYKDIDDIMTSIFHLFLQKVENTTTALNIDGYIFPEVTDTIFVTHRLKGTWILLYHRTALTESLRTANTDMEMRPQIQTTM